MQSYAGVKVYSTYVESQQLEEVTLLAPRFTPLPPKKVRNILRFYTGKYLAYGITFLQLHLRNVAAGSQQLRSTYLQHFHRSVFLPRRAM